MDTSQSLWKKSTIMKLKSLKYNSIRINNVSVTNSLYFCCLVAVGTRVVWYCLPRTMAQQLCGDQTYWIRGRAQIIYGWGPAVIPCEPSQYCQIVWCLYIKSCMSSDGTSWGRITVSRFNYIAYSIFLLHLLAD